VSWLAIPSDSPFPLANLPYGVFTRPGEERRIGVAVGDQVLDLRAAALAGLLAEAGESSWFTPDTLNPLMAAGRPSWVAVRRRLTELLTDAAHEDAVRPHLVPRAEVTLVLPFEVADYVDFYSSIDHATNLGRIFRPDSEPLTPNWRHLPIGYHGRSGTIAVSGTPVRRPQGQRRTSPSAAPSFGPSLRLDIEAEVGFVVGTPTQLGEQVPTSALREHVFGVVLVNDWSARDLQAWEYVPLGPFLGKSFITSISPWVVPLDALEHARIASPPQDPPPLPYLTGGDRWGLDLAMEVRLNGHLISRPPFSRMYWTPAQQLAHLTVNGASLRTGDLFASGTVSGPEPAERGSFIELAWNGAEPLRLPDGESRVFLEDGDEVTITATAPGPDGVRIGFGEVTGVVYPALEAEPAKPEDA
jgi:fumarylacetoacetase